MELLIPKQGWAAIILNSFYIGFIVFTVICLLMRLFIGKRISFIGANIQYSVNLAFAIGIIFRIIFLAFLLYPASADDNVLTEFSNRNVYEDILSRYNTVEMIGDILLWVIGILFLFPVFRRSWIMSFVVLLLMDPGFLFSNFMDITSDYLPSSWDTFYMNETMIKIMQVVLFAVITASMYLFLNKRKKLPYL
jgi:hypothetical protein